MLALVDALENEDVKISVVAVFIVCPQVPKLKAS